ncbi:hypothetical protein [Chitinimonas taiwanensis]|uniref:hypothetical protein n=1 Tax=Chitinimonas taiwanensis TaxID=240412 RepID=UPI001114C94D|nr:hypothetical protein [Chitinimonas taiwanensis]
MLIIERDEIVQPLFSPLWLLATLLTIYIAHITLIINERGWKGAFILIAPALFIIWLAISKHQPVIEPERLEFNSTEESLTITESDGKIKRAHTLKYQDIEALAFHPPRLSQQTRATDLIIIRPINEALPSIRIESIRQV